VRAQAAAKGAALGGVRRQLRLTASLSFDDYFLVQRETEINRVQLDLVHSLRDSAEAGYVAGEGSQKDRLKAEVSLGLLEGERLELRAREALIIAQINGLLHRHPSADLPHPPSTLAPPDPVDGTVESWMARAIAERPVLSATAHRVTAAGEGVSLARRGYLPDFGVSGTYNSMWASMEHRFMVGLSLNLPIHFGALAGRVTEASAVQAQAHAAHAAMQDTVRVEVQQSWARFTEALAQLSLYRDRILPAARQQVVAVEAEVETGRSPFASLMAVQSEVQSLERAHVRALSMTWRRHAALERAVGTDPMRGAQGGVR
jgi:outer membrane protein TolC